MGSGQPDYAGTILGPRVVPATNERRTTVFNDSDLTSGAPPLNRSAIDYGKFFPRGMRGALEEIPIYCLGNAVDTLTVSISPYPGMGPLYSATITPPAVWGWVNAAFNVMWNYDSMYVWIRVCEATVFWAYDNTVKPFDGHHTADSGATFTDLDERPFIRVIMTGETAGDVPISGIINNIKIPNSSSQYLGSNIDIPMGVETLTNRIRGAGYVDLMIMSTTAVAAAGATCFVVYCDGAKAWEWGYVDMNNWGFNDDTQPMSLLTYAVDGQNYMMITKKFEFRRLFELYAYNNFAALRVYTRVYPNLLR